MSVCRLQPNQHCDVWKEKHANTATTITMSRPAAEAPLKIDRRNAGCGEIVDGKLYVWGGETTDIKRIEPDSESSDEWSSSDESQDEEPKVPLEIRVIVSLPRKDDPKHPFDVYNLATCTWSHQATSGDVPALGNGSTLNFHPKSRALYLFGGWNDSRFDAEVYMIPLDTWIWERVRPSSKVKPSQRYLVGALIHEDRLCIIGGTGVSIIADQDPGATYTPRVESQVTFEFGWNNEYYEFDINKQTWCAALAKDSTRPHPSSAHAFVKFDQYRAVFFGGRYMHEEWIHYNNNLFILNLDERIFDGPLKPKSPGQPWPSALTFPTFTPLIDPDRVGQRLCGCGPELEQKMLLLWGKDSEYPQHHISEEAWLMQLDAESITWKQLKVDLKPRSWHIARAAYSAVGTMCQLVIFGGNMHREGSYGDRTAAADPRILVFGTRSLVDSCLSVITACEAQMSRLPHLNIPPKLRGQVLEAYQAELNSPPPTSVTFTRTNAYQ